MMPPDDEPNPETPSFEDSAVTTVRGDRPASELEYFISLDLGSESMAACFQHRNGQEPVTINLQAMAERLSSWLPGKDPLDLLREDDEKTISHRLRTRISLVEGKQPSPLPEAHANVLFKNGSGDSIFRFFHLEGETLNSKLIPNPKLLFQTGIFAVIPRVKGTKGSALYKPEEILEHLTVQILNNLVLNATELRDYAHERGYPPFQRRYAHLTITVPNVYSLTHIKRLEGFVRRHVGVGAIQTMYESDAIAHFMLGEEVAGEPDEVRDMKRRLDGALSAEDGHGISNCRLLTIDIGKGTTDLSLFNYDRNHQARTFTHDVLGRTGRSHGGARLSYLLVEHLESRLQTVLDAVCNDPQADARIHKAIEERRAYLGLLSQPTDSAGRGSVLGAAEKLVEAVKRGIDEDYRLRPDPRLETLATQLAEVLCQEVTLSASIGPVLAGARSEDDERRLEALEIQNQLDKMRDAFSAAFRFPPVLPGGSSKQSFWKWLWSLLRRRSQIQVSPSDPFSQLRTRIEKYVEQNVHEPLQWLIEMADAREKEKKRRSLFGSDAPTFVIIAGQASQFGPIRKAIREQVGELLNVPTGPGGNILFLPSRLAKLACCFGAQWYYRAALRCNNPEEIMGTYGFRQRAAPRAVINLDMQKFNEKNESEFVPLDNGDHWLIFQPRRLPPGRFTANGLDADSVAYIQTFPITHGDKVSVCYRGWGQSIQVVDGDKVYEVEYESTFGDIGRGEGDGIYGKTWPEAVRHAK